MNIYRHDLIFGLSYALDIAGKNNLSHSKSTAYLSVMIGKELGFKGEAELALYYAALLHDIGVSNEYVLHDHCKTGAAMLSKLPLPAEIPLYVLYHHEFYNGAGPNGIKGEDIPKGALVISFASAFDDTFGRRTAEFDRNLFLEVHKWLDALKELFSDEITDAFETLLMKETFLLDYFNYETKYILSDKILVYDPVCYDYEDTLKFALCFADIIDRRSPFTYSHSRAIAELARQAAGYLGYDGNAGDIMYMAGLLHDIGKLHVSTDILHKNGKLSLEERFEINKHTYYTRKILEQIPGLEEIVDIAANHHERIDGTGYPLRISGMQMSELEKVMAICDVYQALAEDRPYRATLPDQKVWDIIAGMAESGALDKYLAEKLKSLFSPDLY